VDALRQRLFALRDELFDFAAGGGLGFSDPGYTRSRMLLNSMIRFTHKLTFSRLVLSTIGRELCSRTERERTIGERPYRQLMEAIDNVPTDAARAKLLSIHSRTAMYIVRHLVLGSPLMLAYLVAYMLWGILVVGAKPPRGGALPPIDALEDEAIMTEAPALETAEVA